MLRTPPPFKVKNSILTLAAIENFFTHPLFFKSNLDINKFIKKCDEINIAKMLFPPNISQHHQ